MFPCCNYITLYYWNRLGSHKEKWSTRITCSKQSSVYLSMFVITIIIKGVQMTDWYPKVVRRILDNISRLLKEEEKTILVQICQCECAEQCPILYLRQLYVNFVLLLSLSVCETCLGVIRESMISGRNIWGLEQLVYLQY